MGYDKIKITNNKRKEKQMTTINETKENIKVIKDFAKYLDYNFKNHAKQAKTSDNLSEIENSLALLKDYEKVAKELIEVIRNYQKHC